MLFLKLFECFFLISYDASNKIWTFVASMLNARSSFGFAVIGNLIYAVGGCDLNESLNSVECFVRFS